ncbi:hypothetical protein P3H15_45175 [Rhodococcus sp. T2V]|uniref:hypothetical protein n=1 Tax=Rhodococcus sp. T2V TaxID=3034164 RepID=UPI0023E265A8|nr:hypothetical protein [Rhodococcus sp. T2V]MDF3312166.1 hypothetical protein [Rhodococcus sp. T2V]
MFTTAIGLGPAELEAARARYRASIGGGSHAEFVAAKVALVELGTGRKVSEGEIDYL